jgi:hypothetical protein
MKTPEDEAFDELARKQGAWGGGFKAKQAMAADKLQEPAQEPVGSLSVRYFRGSKAMTNTDFDYTGDLPEGDYELYTAPPQPAQEPDMLTIAYQSGYYDGKQAALAKREWNFCERCGKRTGDLSVIHTCTPPQGAA